MLGWSKLSKVGPACAVWSTSARSTAEVGEDDGVGDGLRNGSTVDAWSRIS